MSKLNMVPLYLTQNMMSDTELITAWKTKYVCMCRDCRSERAYWTKVEHLFVNAMTNLVTEIERREDCA